MLTTLPEKAAVMQSFGVDGLCVTTFTRARANQSPEDFMAELVEVYAPVVIVCGFNFTFGAGGKGNGQMLKEYGKKHGFRTVIVPEVVIDGETVSSTRIRRLLAQGDMHEVNNLLGRGYSIAGRVEGGQAGRAHHRLPDGEHHHPAAQGAARVRRVCLLSGNERRHFPGGGERRAASDAAGRARHGGSACAG